MFVENNSANGPLLKPIKESDTLKVGEKVIVRLQIESERNIDYVHVNDMRASTFEPLITTSGYVYDGGLWYYKSYTDVGVNLYIQQLQKGSYIIEYPLFVTQKGSFTNGIATIQSLYSPEFGANTKGVRINVMD